MVSESGVFSVMNSSIRIVDGWFGSYIEISMSQNWALVSVELGESSFYQSQIAVFSGNPCVTFERRPDFSSEHSSR